MRRSVIPRVRGEGGRRILLLAGVVYGGRKFADALRSGALRVEGDKSLAKRFLTFFPLPEQASAGTGLEKSRDR
jgi:hypothetical protein